ncbi:MAG: hypothetical protein ACYDEQ_12660 [Desulfocucumaceae bacterium]
MLDEENIIEQFIIDLKKYGIPILSINFGGVQIEIPCDSFIIDGNYLWFCRDDVRMARVDLLSVEFNKRHKSGSESLKSRACYDIFSDGSRVLELIWPILS